MIGILVSSFPGVAYGPSYYRALESANFAGLRASKGNHSFKISLPLEAKRELQWLIDDVKKATNRIYICTIRCLVNWLGRRR